MGDRIMLEAIIRNLLTNAIKFSEPGGKISHLGAEGKGDISWWKWPIMEWE